MEQFFHRLGFLTLLGLVVCGVGATPISSSFPPQTGVVIRLDVMKAKQMPVLVDFLNRKTGGIDTLIQNIKTWTGVDLDAVETAWVGVEKKDHAVIVLQGPFDKQAIENAILNIASAQIVQRAKVPFAVMMPDDKHPGEFNLAGLLNEKTLVFGKPYLVDAYLAAYTGAEKGLPQEKAAMVGAMEPSEAALDAAILALPAKELQKNPWLALFTGALIQADLTQTFDMTLTVGVKDARAADPIRKIVEGLRDVYKLLDENQQKFPEAVEILLENATVEVVHDKLVVDVSVPEETFDRFAREKLMK